MESSFFASIAALLGSATLSPLAAGALIVFLTAFFEDPTTIIVGVLAADGALSIRFAMICLYLGILFGDLFLYGLGRLARTNPALARYVENEKIAPLRFWLETRYILTVFSVRFIPGLRLPTYLASGFFKSPAPAFLLTAVVATFLWTLILFYAFYWYGSLTASWIGWVRYGLAAGFFVLLFLLGRRNLRAYRARAEEEDARKA
jgi:membrane protein DedA with SNARE-associated domain